MIKISFIIGRYTVPKKTTLDFEQTAERNTRRVVHKGIYNDVNNVRYGLRIQSVNTRTYPTSQVTLSQKYKFKTPTNRHFKTVIYP